MSNIQKWTAPTIGELSTEIEKLAETDILNIALNQVPPQRWIRQHPMVNVKVYDSEGNERSEPLKYMPIEFQRILAKRFFGIVKEEILAEGVMFQSVYVRARIHFNNPITGEALFMDGIGAVDAQTKKGTSAADLANINSGAIQKGLPAAASYAFSNAYAKLGKVFGGDIQKNVNDFESIAMYSKNFYDAPNIEDLTELYEMKKEAITDKEIIRNAERIINNKETKSYTKLYKTLQSL